MQWLGKFNNPKFDLEKKTGCLSYLTTSCLYIYFYVIHKVIHRNSAHENLVI